MKTYRVWAYETIGHYVDIRANNKADAYTKAMDVNVLDWEQSADKDYPNLNIKKKDIREIKTNVVKLKIKKPWSEGYKEWKENTND